jgi:hypothetical protein
MRLYGWIRSLALALTGLFVLAAPAAAQLSGGVKAGLTFSTIATDPDSEGALGNRIDFAAGGFLVVSRDARATAVVEVLASRRGADIVTPIIDLGFGLGSVRLTYIDVSGLLRLRVNESAANQIYVLAGPTVSFKMDARVNVAGFETDISDVVEDTDLGLTVGVGVETGLLLVEGRYTHGLRDILIGVDFAGVSVRSRSFSFLAGIKF